MEGNCVMQSANINYDMRNSESMEKCQINCLSEPLCLFYKYSVSENTCEYFPNTRYGCSTYLGVPDHIEKRCPSG